MRERERERGEREKENPIIHDCNIMWKHKPSDHKFKSDSLCMSHVKEAD